METFLLVLAALFPVVNPPGSALIFLSMTPGASSAIRRSLARRVALNALVIMAASLSVGGVILRLYGISIPILRVAGGLIVAATGWKLLSEGNPKAITEDEIASNERKANLMDLAFYPLTLPITTGPGTIAVMISLGLHRSTSSGGGPEIQFFIAALAATLIVAATIYICFAYSEWVARVFGSVGTDILVRLTAFILFCLGLQIVWSGVSELLGTITLQRVSS